MQIHSVIYFPLLFSPVALYRYQSTKSFKKLFSFLFSAAIRLLNKGFAVVLPKGMYNLS